MIHRAVICAALGMAAGLAVNRPRKGRPTFRKIQLTDNFWSEGAAYADINHDGIMDIVSGPFWYAGPDFKTRHEYRKATQDSFTTTNTAGESITIPGFEGAKGEKNDYSDDFLTFTYDINGDGWPDIIVVGYPGKEAYWYENPRDNSNTSWARHTIIDSTDDESPGFGDLLGDGKAELLCCTSNYLGYAAPDWKNPGEKWTFHRVSPKNPDYRALLARPRFWRCQR